MDRITHEVRREQWLAIMEECLASGKPKTVWCKENGISDKQFFYWQRVLRKEAYLDKSKNTAEIATFSESESRLASVPFIELQQPMEDITKSEFHPDVVIRTDTLTIEISNTVSEVLLNKIGGLLHAK